MAIFYTIKWYRTDKFWDLIKIAFSISFAMMAKIDSALIAIPIGIVFLVKLIKNRKEIKKYILYFSIFALISLPIGLWYPIKNLVLYDVPLTYVQSVERDHPMNVEKFSKARRLFDIASGSTYKDINIKLIGKEKDFNILITTLKTAIVDEYIGYDPNNIEEVDMYYLVNTLEYVIFAVLIMIIIIYIINLIYILKNYKKINNHWILFFIGLLIIESFSYIKFCFEFPFVCTMHFRYIIPTLISFAVITGIASENNKILLRANQIIFSFSSILSIMLFFLVK